MGIGNKLGLDNLPLIGEDLHKMPLVGGLFDDPAEKGLQDQFKKQQAAYEDYRQVSIDARMNALKNLFSLMGPTNDFLGQVGLPQYDLGAATQNPWPTQPDGRQGPPPSIPKPAGGAQPQGGAAPPASSPFGAPRPQAETPPMPSGRTGLGWGR